ncbi:MAG: hypothetical protein BWY63_01474 [Chloroflexi bacterium ADurb.Bin360]|nr:MAG: hypothetical protein BWY63_01474 [Chloroflexi bacterium ADurb.Bin360]
MGCELGDPLPLHSGIWFSLAHIGEMRKCAERGIQRGEGSLTQRRRDAEALSTEALSTEALSTAALSTAVLSTAALSTAALSTAALSTAVLSTAVLSTAVLSTAALSTAALMKKTTRIDSKLHNEARWQPCSPAMMSFQSLVR